jgi:hypothetical protein
MSDEKKSNSIITVPFRLAFPEVFTAKASVEGGKAKFSVTMLYPKDGSALIPSMPGDGILELRKLALAAIKEKWGEDKTKWPASIKAIDLKTYVSPNGKDGWPIRDGNLVEWDGFAGQLFVRASSQFQPGIVDQKLQPIIDKSAVYGGLICRAQVNAFAYDNAGNRGVSFGLNNLQVLKDDGVVFGGKQNAAEVFDAFAASGDLASGGSTGPDDDFA